VGEKNLRRKDRAIFLKLALQTPGLESSMKDFLQSMGDDVQTETDCSTDYNPLLLTAAACGQNEVVQTLLSSSKAEPNYSDHNGMTAMHFAAANDHVEVIKTLLASGAHVECMDKGEDTPLHLAARRKDARCVEVLTSHITDLNRVNCKAMSPLHSAAVNGNLFALKCMVDWAKSHDIRIMMAGFHDRRSLLLFAAEGGSLEVIDYVLDNISNIDVSIVTEDKCNSLHLASNCASDSAVQRFLKLGLGPNERTRDGLTPLHMAVASDDIGSESKKSLAVVKSLLAYGANVDARTNDGTTALHMICARGIDYDGYRIFEALVDNGASANLKDTRDTTALSVLCRFVPHNLRALYLNALQKLISSGAEVDTVDIDGESAFLLAARYFVHIANSHLENSSHEDLRFATQLLDSIRP
jgi:ankyrin repeat protein